MIPKLTERQQIDLLALLALAMLCIVLPLCAMYA